MERDPLTHTLAGEHGKCLKQAARDLREADIVELIGRITRGVVVPVSVKRRVSHHDGGIAVALKRLLVTPGNSGNEPESRYRLQRKSELARKAQASCRKAPLERKSDTIPMKFPRSGKKKRKSGG